jgi:uncharacterized Fe-S cluster-containing protein
MKTTETILFEQLKKHATDYIESEDRGIVVDDLDVDSFLEETSKLLKANEAKTSDERERLIAFITDLTESEAAYRELPNEQIVDEYLKQFD